MKRFTRSISTRRTLSRVHQARRATARAPSAKPCQAVSTISLALEQASNGRTSIKHCALSLIPPFIHRSACSSMRLWGIVRPRNVSRQDISPIAERRDKMDRRLYHVAQKSDSSRFLTTSTVDHPCQPLGKIPIGSGCRIRSRCTKLAYSSTGYFRLSRPSLIPPFWDVAPSPAHWD